MVQSISGRAREALARKYDIFATRDDSPTRGWWWWCEMSTKMEAENAYTGAGRGATSDTIACCATTQHERDRRNDGIFSRDATASGATRSEPTVGVVGVFIPTTKFAWIQRTQPQNNICTLKSPAQHTSGRME